MMINNIVPKVNPVSPLTLPSPLEGEGRVRGDTYHGIGDAS
jgi:hypothetical protein